MITHHFFLESPSMKTTWLLANGWEFVRDVLVPKDENVWSPFKGQATTMSHLLSIVKICSVCLTKYSKTIIFFLIHNMTFLWTWSELWECPSKQCINHTWVLLYNSVQCGMGTRTKANVPLFEGTRTRTRGDVPLFEGMWTRTMAGVPLFAHRNKDKVFLGLRAHWNKCKCQHSIGWPWEQYFGEPWLHIGTSYSIFLEPCGEKLLEVITFQRVGEATNIHHGSTWKSITSKVWIASQKMSYDGILGNNTSIL